MNQGLQRFFQPGTTPCCPEPTRDQQMDILIGLFQQIAGVNYTCQQLEALALQYACIPRPLQLPALIYLATQILAASGIQIPGPIGPQGPPGQNGATQG